MAHSNYYRPAFVWGEQLASLGDATALPRSVGDLLALGQRQKLLLEDAPLLRHVVEPTLQSVLDR
jgi:hypothetical protein